jgi:hypothetical protein
MDLPAAAPRSRRRSRAWVAFFVLLLALASVGVAMPILYNLGQQLRPEQLAAARQRWRDHGPADYDLTYQVAYDRDPLAERHIVLVRGGKVVFASCEGEVRYQAPALAAAVGLPAGGLGKGGGLDVPAVFDHIDELLREQGAAARRNFLVAVFDPKDGYPRRFIRRVRGTPAREEWNLRLWPAGALGSGGKR